MSFFDDLGGALGNLFHGIGSFFGGGNNNSSAPQVSSNNNNVLSNARNFTPSPSGASAPQQLNLSQPAQQNNTPQPKAPAINLFQGVQNNPNTVGILNKPGTQLPSPSPSAAPVQQAQGPGYNLAGDVANTFINPLANAPLVKPIVQPFARALNQAGTEIANGVITGKTGLDQALGASPNVISNDLALERAGQDQYNSNSGGLFNMGTIADANDAKNPNIGKLAEKFGGNFLQSAATVAAPGLDNLAEKGVSTLVPDATGALVKAATTVVPKSLTGAATLGTMGGGNALENGQNVAQGFGEGALAGLAGGTAVGALPLVRAGIKALPSVLSRVGTATSDVAPDELAAGVKSANDNGTADALRQILESQTPESKGFATDQTTLGQNAQPTLQEAQPLQQTELPLEAAPQLSSDQVQPASTEIQPTTQTEVPTQGAQSPTSQVQSPNLSSSSQSPLLSNNVPQGETAVNTSGKTAPNAPDLLESINREIQSNNPGDVHDVIDKQMMAQRGLQNAQTADLPAAIAQHSQQVPSIQTPQDAFDATALMRRMYSEAKDDPASATARDNLANGVAEYISKGGQVLNTARDLVAGLPADARANVMVRSLQKIWSDAKNMPPELNTAAGRSYIQSNIEDALNQGEATNQEIARLQGQIEELSKDPANIQQMHDVGHQLQQVELKQMIDNGNAAKYFSSLLPGKGKFEKLSDMARTSMLTSVGGRLNNFVNVGSNSAYELATSLVQSQIARVTNLFSSDDNQVATKSLFNAGLARGIPTGLKRAGAELSGKTLSNSSIESTIDRAKTNGYGLSSSVSRGPISKFVGGLVNAPKNIFGQPIKDAQLVRQAQQEGLQQGLSGDELKAYTVMRSYVPSKIGQDNAQVLMDQVSHTNHNWLADKIGGWLEANKVNNSFARGIIGLARNSILPFAKYPATYLWNTIGDRNLAADSARFAVAALRKDIPGVTKALSRAVVDGGLGTMGYQLYNSGVITDKNGAGYNDAGLYLHFGNRYIPLGLFGVIAEPLLGGAVLAASTKKGGDPLANAVNTIGGTFMDTLNLGGAQTFIGADNTGLTTLQNAVLHKNNTTAQDAAAALGAQAAGQFIPGAFSDANAILNHTALNPTGESADTKITKGDLGQVTKGGKLSTAKDIPSSLGLSLLNRIPGVSQMLPRAPGTTANDMLDRVTRGDHVGPAQQAVADQKQAQLNTVQQELKNGIPVYDKQADGVTKVQGLPKGYTYANALESAIENSQFDKAAQGLQSELKALQSTPSEPQSKIQAVKDKITQFNIANKDGISYADMKLYNSTSVSQWRAMGNSSKDTYDPQTYQKLYAIDRALANEGVAGAFGIGSTAAKASDTPKYSLAASSSSSRSSSASRASRAASLVKSNKIGSLPALPAMDFTTNLKATPVSVNIPQVKLTSPGSLIKTHAISVGFPRGNYN